MRKKFIFLTMIVVFTLIVLTACNAKEKVSENIAEKLIGDAIGGKVEIDGDSGTIETEGGTISFGDNLKWPKEDMGDLPELKAKISSVTRDENARGSSVTFSGLSLKDAKAYIEDLKDLGYESIFDSTFDSTDNLIITFNGSKAGSNGVLFSYTISSEDGALIYTLIE